ncbi:MAG: glycerophosphodiester phosphodiesterase [Ignavibacteriae bacterium]|nr:glycerophosphodiester phosphodiesterase [Ignavibacteriota bacterium]
MKTQIIAHRGESFEAPENTLASINLAWERNVDAIEIDVHLSKDNYVVVIHDSTLKRISGINKKVKNLNLYELKNFDVGSWKSDQFANEKIPTLNEVLITIPNSGKIIIEIKSDIKILTYLKNDIIESKLKPEQIEIISFKYSVVKEAKKIFPQNKILFNAYLDYNFYTKIISQNADKLIDKIKNAHLDGLNVFAGNMLDENFVKKIKSENLILYAWTIDNLKTAKRLISFGIDGIITNKPSWLKLQNL